MNTKTNYSLFSVDLAPSLFTGAPGATNPMLAATAQTGVTVGITITNGALAAGQGSDITAVASPNLNYKFTIQYSSASTLTPVGTAFTPTFAAADLRQGLAGASGTATLTGTANFAAISAAVCQSISQSISHVCMKVEPDTLKGASFIVVTVNSSCEPIVVSCFPGKCDGLWVSILIA